MRTRAQPERDRESDRRATKLQARGISLEIDGHCPKVYREREEVERRRRRARETFECKWLGRPERQITPRYRGPYVRRALRFAVPSAYRLQINFAICTTPVTRARMCVRSLKKFYDSFLFSSSLSFSSRPHTSFCSSSYLLPSH